MRVRQKQISIRKRCCLAPFRAVILFTFGCLCSAEVSAKFNPTELECAAYAVYHEARGESVARWRFVADIVHERKLRRKLHGCDVIKEVAGGKRQFSFWRGKWEPPRELTVYRQIQNELASGRFYGAAKGQTNFRN